MSDQNFESIRKGVKLLLSNDENSTAELEALLNEQIRLRYGSRRAEGIANVRRHALHSLNHRVERNSSTSESDKFLPPRPKRKIIRNKCMNTSRSLTIGMNVISGISSSYSEVLCMICKGTQTTWLNNLVECANCHRLCHQNCATPPIMDIPFNAGIIWYCHCCKTRSNTSIIFDDFCNVLYCYETSPPENESSVISLLPVTSNDLCRRICSSAAGSNSAAPSTSSTGATDSSSTTRKKISAASVSNVYKYVRMIRPQNTLSTLVDKSD